jgi:hypothetical protein
MQRLERGVGVERPQEGGAAVDLDGLAGADGEIESVDRLYGTVALGDLGEGDRVHVPNGRNPRSAG